MRIYFIFHYITKLKFKNNYNLIKNLYKREVNFFFFEKKGIRLLLNKETKQNKNKIGPKVGK